MKGIMGHTPVRLLLEPGQPLLFGGEIWFHAGRATDKQRRLLFRNKDGLSREWTDREVLKLQQAGDLRFLTAADRDRLEKAEGPATPRAILDTCTAADKKVLVYELMRFTDRYTETFCHRGKREADHKYRMVEDGPGTERHNEAWEIDHTTVDLIVVDHATGLPVGRPFITMTIDRHTRMIVGYHVGWAFPGIQPTLECLRCAIAIKDEVLKKAPGLRNHWPAFGTPGLLVPDNAKHFKSKAFKEACRRLGIDVARPPVLKSWYKGKIERAFGTYVKGLCHLIPGTTFSNVYQRLKEKIPEKVAICTLAEFDAMLLRFIVDIYNPRCNRIMNTSPLLAYAVSVAKFKQKLPPNPAELASKLSIPYYRKVSREGILFQGLWYRGGGVADLLTNKRLSRTVLVKVDPNDLSRIWFIHPETNEPVEWKISKSQAESVRGINLDMHLLAKAMQRNEPELLAGEAGRVEAYALIHKMLEERVRGDGLANRRLAAKHLDRLRKREEAYVVEEADDEDATPPEDLDIGDELFPADASGAPAPVDAIAGAPADPADDGPRIVATIAAPVAAVPKKRGRPPGKGRKATRAPAPATTHAPPQAPVPPPVPAPAIVPIGTDEDLDLDRFVRGKITIRQGGDKT